MSVSFVERVSISLPNFSLVILAYICVLVIHLCPNRLLTDSMGMPLDKLYNRCHRVTGYVPRYMFVDAAFLDDSFKLVATIDMRGNGEGIPIVTKPAVFVEDLQGNIEQFNVYLHACLLSAGTYPHISVEWTADDIIFTKVLQINVGKSRKSAEEKHIANKRFVRV